MPAVLVIDDDRTVLGLVRRALRDMDVCVLTAGSAEEGLAAIHEHGPDALLLDVMLPDGSGLEVAYEVRRIDPRLPVSFITMSDDSDTAIEAMKLGAYDILLKPLDIEKVADVVERALEIRRMMQVPVKMADDERDEAAAGENQDLLVGRSPRMLGVYKEVGRVAEQDVSVLIYGESGTGKELEMFERYLVTRILRETEGNQSKAAERLGITRGSLRHKIRSLGISIDHVVQ
jgi:two-component system nitrogen regulation response regulator GlnG